MTGLLWRCLRWFLFRLDAERAHHLTLAWIRIGIRLGGVPLRIVGGTRVQSPGPSSPEVFGIKFLSRVGLAAGFDKNCDILTGLPDLGFGFAEIGTVTPRPQSGNDRPRLFRDADTGAIFNRMGFNNLGASVVAGRLGASRHLLPPGFRVGINIGKNKDTPNEEAVGDYVRAAREFSGLVDFVVVNISSPNTPGLRSLQTAEGLRPIVGGLKDLLSTWRLSPPLLVKVAPELHFAELDELIRQIEPLGVDGWVLTNTLSGKWERGVSKSLDGGWSGRPLTGKARASLEYVRSITTRPLISVGGIMSEEEAKARRDAGADLIQIYSGWIFRGPRFVSKISHF